MPNNWIAFEFDVLFSNVLRQWYIPVLKGQMSINTGEPLWFEIKINLYTIVSPRYEKIPKGMLISPLRQIFGTYLQFLQ